MKNLRAHEKQTRHMLASKQAAARRRAPLEASEPSGSRAKRFKATVEDVPDEDDYDNPWGVDSNYGHGMDSWEEHPIAGPSQDPEALLRDLVETLCTEGLQSGHNLAGSDETEASNEARAALRHALEGMNIINAALSPFDDEAPDAELEEFDDIGGIEDSMRGAFLFP